MLSKEENDFPKKKMIDLIAVFFQKSSSAMVCILFKFFEL